MGPREVAQLGHRVLLIGVDDDQRHAPICELVGQRDQPRGIQLGLRALGAHEGDNDDLILGEIGQSDLLAAIVAGREVVDPFTDRGGLVGNNRAGANAQRRGGQRGQEELAHLSTSVVSRVTCAENCAARRSQVGQLSQPAGISTPK